MDDNKDYKDWFEENITSPSGPTETPAPQPSNQKEEKKILDLGFKKKIKLLIAEDDQFIASMLEDWLSEEFDVAVALNGKIALQKAKSFQPDIIAMDIVMPDMGGYEVSRALQSAYETSNIPIIAMTAKVYDDSTVKLIKSEPNVKGFLNKPFKPEELKKKIIELLSQKDKPLPPLKQAPATSVQEDGKAAAAKPGTYAKPTPQTTAKPQPQGTPRQKQVPAGKTAGPAKPGTFLSKMTKFFTWIISLLAVVFTSGEITCRLLEAELGKNLFNPMVITSHIEGLFYQHRPNCKWQSSGVNYKTNSQGLRDDEYTQEGNPQTLRILCIGGSNTFGVGCNSKDAYPKQIETMLNQKLTGVKYAKFEVLNMGQWEYDIQQETTLLKSIGVSYSPDIAIIAYDMERHIKNPDSIKKLNAILPAKMEIFLKSKSAFYKLLARKIFKLKAEMKLKKTGAGKAEAARHLNMENSFRDLSDLQWKKNMGLFILLIPPVTSREILGELSSAEIREKILKSAKIHNLKIIDLFDVFGNETSRTMEGRKHMHNVITAKVVERLESENLLQPAEQKDTNINGGTN